MLATETRIINLANCDGGTRADLENFLTDEQIIDVRPCGDDRELLTHRLQIDYSDFWWDDNPDGIQPTLVVRVLCKDDSCQHYWAKYRLWLISVDENRVALYSVHEE